jgi:hypothetical protein
MKQPNLVERIIIMSIEGINMGISYGIRKFISLILRLVTGTNAFADCGQSNNVAFPSSDSW